MPELPNWEMYCTYMERAERGGYELDLHRDFVPTYNGFLRGHREIPIILRASVLRAVYGRLWRKVGHEAFDVWLSGGNVLEFLIRKLPKK